jgi:hypothetical protein
VYRNRNNKIISGIDTKIDLSIMVAVMIPTVLLGTLENSVLLFYIYVIS